MTRDKKSSGIFEPKGIIHFNVMYKGSGMASRILAREIEGCHASDIEWIWIVEVERKATLREIRQLCAGTWKGSWRAPGTVHYKTPASNRQGIY